ncbi:MAG: cytochrome C oxidase subunit II [Myxococcota bacterium]|nr:cytochrome C oxidase subunit II [Myxococcota bacterium]
MIEQYVPQLSTYAGDIDFVFDLIFYITTGWFILTQGVFFWLMWRFRRQEGVKALYLTGEEKFPKNIVSNAHHAVLVFDVAILVFAVMTWHNVKITLPPAEQTIRVVAQQWAWTFIHPGPDGEIDTADDIAMNDELHVLVDTMYHFKLESRDVLHNFSVPVFRLKQDVIPGRVITGWFKATGTGEHDIQCAEICGIGHGLMPARIFIETHAEHMAWMNRHLPSGVAANDASSTVLAQE